MLHSPDDNVKSIERGRALESVIYNKWIDLYGDDFFPGPVQAIDRMKKDIVAMRGVVSAVKKSMKVNMFTKKMK